MLTFSECKILALQIHWQDFNCFALTYTVSVMTCMRSQVRFIYLYNFCFICVYQGFMVRTWVSNNKQKMRNIYPLQNRVGVRTRAQTTLEKTNTSQ